MAQQIEIPVAGFQNQIFSLMLRLPPVLGYELRVMGKRNHKFNKDSTHNESSSPIAFVYALMKIAPRFL